MNRLWLRDRPDLRAFLDRGVGADLVCGCGAPRLVVDLRSVAAVVGPSQTIVGRRGWCLACGRRAPFLGRPPGGMALMLSAPDR